MGVLEAVLASQVQAGGEGCQDDLGDGVAAADDLLQLVEIAAVLDRGGDARAALLDLVSRDLEHLIAVLGASTKGASAVTDRLVAKMGVDQAIFVLGLEGGIKEAVHELEKLLTVLEHATAVDAVEIELEVTILKASLEHLLDLLRILREEQIVLDGPHGPDRNLPALPFDGLYGFGGRSHDDMWAVEKFTSSVL